MTTRIVHVSDTHGVLYTIPRDGDLVVHSGDFLGNISRGNWTLEPKYQAAWIEDNVERIRAWLGGRLFLFCAGNHDFMDPRRLVDELNNYGIPAVNITNTSYTHNGLTFYGFPYIPYLAGEWNYESQEEDIREKLQAVPKVDVLVAHAPPGSVLDRTALSLKVGSRAIASWLAYAENVPSKAYLCGHTHESPGVTVVNGILVSNAATTYQVIEL